MSIGSMAVMLMPPLRGLGIIWPGRSYKDVAPTALRTRHDRPAHAAPRQPREGHLICRRPAPIVFQPQRGDIFVVREPGTSKLRRSDIVAEMPPLRGWVVCLGGRDYKDSAPTELDFATNVENKRSNIWKRPVALPLLRVRARSI